MTETENPSAPAATNYELMVIFTPDLGEEGVKKELDELHKLLSSGGGQISHKDFWGLREFAYRIKKQDEGYYAVTNFSIPPGKITELEGHFNIQQTILRYAIIRTPTNYQIKTLKDYLEEASEAQKKEAKEGENEGKPKKTVSKRPEVKKTVLKKEPKSEESIADTTEKTAKPHKETEKEKSGDEAGDEIEKATKETEKKKEQGDLEDFDKKLKSIIDDPDISL